MHVHLEPLVPGLREPVMDIFNHYVQNGFAAYPENKLPYEAFDMFMKMSEGYPAVTANDENGHVLGFGMLRPHHPLPVFSGVAEITYFIRPECTGRGIGVMMLEHLLRGAREKGLSSILASISSLNEGSINFHRKNGFAECGRFREIGKKNGQVFDVVWMQRML